MKAPSIIAKDNELEIEGNFEFTISKEPTVWNEKEFKPYKKIEFYINQETPHTMMQMNHLGLDIDKIVELYVEQMKVDFEQFLRDNV